ncbi:unnamed protein product [Candidula unifasciata]|uniref:IkappaB kinase n=1 Tax=Candidula unifasciata TaxID=100452 RepID=A0A8S3YGN2_9EUPU|nr:unnamed protein product [Candidula unifasciata]
MSTDQQAERGTWKQKQVLGQGGFGTVELWYNEKAQEHIAIKKCKLKNDMPEKMWDRWKMEVYIMSKLNHENVIKAVLVPPQLEPNSGEPPVLAMEFCEGGDLRKILNLPDNCYGLPEKEIRQLVTGVGSAVEYLHSNRIIHRDLKPENIVLKHLDDNRTAYKIIDLGYAKELDITSICDSFVGTVQYLAPELFISKPYSKTVDYWSFGCMIFECITGFRPFLPTAPPVEWHAEVCKKSPDDISVQYDENKQIKFSKKLPFPNQLCKPFQNYFEQWLRLMLRWDPKARGGGIIQVQGVERSKCFYLIEQMMSLKILQILHVEANSILSYPINESHTIANLKEAIEFETGIPAAQQEIILATGAKMSPTDLALNAYCEPLTDDPVVFLYRKGPMQLQQRKNKILPVAVQAIVKDPNILLPPRDHRKAWAQAVYWFTEQNRDYKRLILSHRAALLNLLLSNTSLTKKKSFMCSEIGKLLACKEQFQASLDFDMQQYRDTSVVCGKVFNGISGEMLLQWAQMAQKIDSFIALNDRVKQLDAKATAVTTEIVEIQRSPFSRLKQANELEEFEKKAKQLYAELLRATQGDSSHEIMDHVGMVELVGKCYLKRDEVTKILYKHLSKVMDCQHRLDPLLPQLEMACTEIEAARKQLVSMQCKRQADLWALLNHTVNGTSNPEEDTNALNTITLTSPSPSFVQNTAMQELPSMESTLESIRLMDDCKTNSQRLQDMVTTMIKEQEESMLYFSSLDSTR